MRATWLKLGCFLLGYNYAILRGCSELSAQKVIRLTSAMVLICTLWAFIGFTFSERYLQTSKVWSLFAGLLMLLLVVQIERQVILSNRENKLPFYFRTIIAMLMAVIGSTIVDQIIFKDDIDKQKLLTMDETVNQVLPAKTIDLRSQIEGIDQVIRAKEAERALLVNDITKHPKITIYTKEKISQGKAGIKEDSTRTETVTSTSSQIANPKMDLLKPLDDQIKSLREEKFKKDSSLLVLRPAIEAEIKANVGFLDELNLMMDILKKSGIAMSVWIIWFVLLLGVELFILVSKWRDVECDYERMLKFQMDLHFKRIELLKTQSN